MMGRLTRRVFQNLTNCCRNGKWWYFTVLFLVLPDVAHITSVDLEKVTSMLLYYTPSHFRECHCILFLIHKNVCDEGIKQYM